MQQYVTATPICLPGIHNTRLAENVLEDFDLVLGDHVRRLPIVPVQTFLLIDIFATNKGLQYRLAAYGGSKEHTANLVAWHFLYKGKYCVTTFLTN